MSGIVSALSLTGTDRALHIGSRARTRLGNCFSDSSGLAQSPSPGDHDSSAPWVADLLWRRPKQGCAADSTDTVTRAEARANTQFVEWPEEPCLAELTHLGYERGARVTKPRASARSNVQHP